MIMAADYVHIELETAQSSKRPGVAVRRCLRLRSHGRGDKRRVCRRDRSGIRAAIAARMCASRLLELLRLGFSLRKAFSAVVRTMQQNRDPSRPFAAFTLARDPQRRHDEYSDLRRPAADFYRPPQPRRCRAIGRGRVGARGRGRLLAGAGRRPDADERRHHAGRAGRASARAGRRTASLAMSAIALPAALPPVKFPRWSTRKPAACRRGAATIAPCSGSMSSRAGRQPFDRTTAGPSRDTAGGRPFMETKGVEDRLRRQDGRDRGPGGRQAAGRGAGLRRA